MPRATAKKTGAKKAGAKKGGTKKGGANKGDIRLRLDLFRKKNGGNINIDDLADALDAAVARADDKLTAKDRAFLKELETIAGIIRSAKAEIAQIRPLEVKTELIPTATNELDAILDATEKATHEIIDAAEFIEGVSEKLDKDLAGEIQGATTRIFLACGFQDITGQRTAKVVEALKNIEAKIDGLLSAFGEGPTPGKVKAAANAKKKPGKQKTSDDDLLAGPQLPAKANKQEEIDALLASFD